MKLVFWQVSSLVLFSAGSLQLAEGGSGLQTGVSVRRFFTLRFVPIFPLVSGFSPRGVVSGSGNKTFNLSYQSRIRSTSKNQPIRNLTYLDGEAESFWSVPFQQSDLGRPHQFVCRGNNSAAWYELLTRGPENTYLKPRSSAMTLYCLKTSGLTYSTTGM